MLVQVNVVVSLTGFACRIDVNHRSRKERQMVSQFMLAVPLWLLYEAGIWVAVWMIKMPKVDSTEVEKI